MIEILGHLGTAKTRISLLHSVIFENKYYGTLLLILLMLYLAEGTMTQFVAQAPAVAEVSMAGVIFFIHHNGVWLVTLLVIVIAMLSFSRTQHYGLRRKYLGPFDGDYRRPRQPCRRARWHLTRWRGGAAVSGDGAGGQSRRLPRRLRCWTGWKAFLLDGTPQTHRSNALPITAHRHRPSHLWRPEEGRCAPSLSIHNKSN
jgi:hypothetical protein